MYTLCGLLCKCINCDKTFLKQLGNKTMVGHDMTLLIFLDLMIA